MHLFSLQSVTKLLRRMNLAKSLKISETEKKLRSESASWRIGPKVDEFILPPKQGESSHAHSVSPVVCPKSDARLSHQGFRDGHAWLSTWLLLELNLKLQNGDRQIKDIFA